MLTLIASLAFLSPVTQPPAWVQELLRAAPPTPAPAQRPSPTPEQIAKFNAQPHGEHRTGIAVPVPYNGPSDPDAAAKGIDALVSNGQYQDAYRAALFAYPDDQLDEISGRLPNVALLAGRSAQVERILVRYVRNAENSFGTYGEYYDQLSYAAAAQGRVYPGQAAYALASLRGALKIPSLAIPSEDNRGLKAPRTAPEVARISLLALGLKTPALYGRAYLERVLTQDPTCEIAAQGWFAKYDGSQFEVAVRIARSMVEHLPEGEGRSDFARRLAYLKRARKELPSLPSKP